MLWRGGLRVGEWSAARNKEKWLQFWTRRKLRIHRQTVDTCRRVSASVLGRLESSGDTCCPLAFLLSNGNSLHWFIFLPVWGGCRHFSSHSSRELFNEKRVAVNQQSGTLVTVRTRRRGGGGIGRGGQWGIIRGGLTFDWTSPAITDSAVPSLIYWLFCPQLWQIRLCLRGPCSLRKCLKPPVFNLPQALFEVIYKRVKLICSEEFCLFFIWWCIFTLIPQHWFPSHRDVS